MKRLFTMRFIFAPTLAVALTGCTTDSPSHPASRKQEDQALREQNAQLRDAVGAAMVRQMQDISIFSAYYRNEHGQWPSRPSDLREVIAKRQSWRGPELFLAPYDFKRLLDQLNKSKDPWGWVDTSGSFTFYGGAADKDRNWVVFCERRAVLGEGRWAAFADGHIAYISDR